MLYDPAPFHKSTFDTENGQVIWDFLNDGANITRMETATFFGKPAIEPLSPIIRAYFPQFTTHDPVHKMMGHMVRQIMERRGYELDEENQKIESADNIFKTAATYRKS